MTEPALADLAAHRSAASPTRAPRRRAGAGRARRRPDRGGATRSSTRSTSAASPTATATAPATSPASARACPTCATSASTPSGSPRGTSRRSPTAATTSPTTAPSTRPSARSRRPRRSSPRRSPSASGRSSTSSPTTSPTATRGSRRRSRPGPGSPERDRFWFRPGRGDGRRRAADRLAVRVPGRHLDPDDRTRRHARRVVPPPVHRRAARPQLGSPGRPRRARGDPALLVRPRRRRASASTRPRCWSRTRAMPEVPADPAPGRSPDPGPRRAPRHLPRLARVADCYPGHARPRRRALARRHRPVRAVPPPRRAAHGLQLRLHGPAVARRRPARLDRCDARRARPGRSARHVGPVEPRCDPAGHPLRPRRHLVRLPPQALRHRRPTSISVAAGHAPPPCSPPPCPGRSTSTRATSSGSTRSRSRSTRSRIRCTADPAASTRAATAAACRCPGAGPRRRSASARPSDRPRRG